MAPRKKTFTPTLRKEKRRDSVWPKGFACLFIALSILLVSGPIAGWRLWQKRQRLPEPLRYITAIAQTGPSRESLPSDLLAELMKLSMDAPVRAAGFLPKAAEGQLRAFPLIRNAAVKLVPPGTVYVDYEVRSAKAWLADFQNAAVDSEGVLFPVSPFLSPKRLPKIVLGLTPKQCKWGEKLSSSSQGQNWELAQKLLTTLEAPPYRDLLAVEQIDCSHALARSRGEREIVLVLVDKLQPPTGPLRSFYRFVRLNPKELESGLQRYLLLREKLLEQELSQLRAGEEPTHECVIDLRLSHLAYLD